MSEVRSEKDREDTRPRSYTTITTWLGRPGTQHCTSKGLGLRAVAHIWDDEDTATVRVVKGDAWKRPSEFRELAKVVVPADDAIDTMWSLLAEVKAR